MMALDMRRPIASCPQKRMPSAAANLGVGVRSTPTGLGPAPERALGLENLSLRI